MKKHIALVLLVAALLSGCEWISSLFPPPGGGSNGEPDTEGNLLI